VSPNKDKLRFVLRILFPASNNVTEYEACLHGIRLVVELGVKRLYVHGDSALVINQLNKEWDTTHEKMDLYCKEIRKWESNFYGELAVNLLAFWKTLHFIKVKWAHFINKRNIFSQEHHAFFEQSASSMIMLVNYLLSWSKYYCNCLGDIHANRRYQALLVEEAQDDVLHINTRCSGTRCGGINPYTLTARLGPGGLAHSETSLRLDLIARSFAQGNKTWRSSRILVG